jgi:hypothetical protein
VQLFWRFSVFILIAGFVGGWWLRLRAGGNYLAALVRVIFVPWLLHLLYALAHVVRREGITELWMLTAILNFAFGASLLVFAGLFYRARPRLAAAVPLTLGLVHLALLGFYQTFSVHGIVFPTLPNLYFVAATLFAVAGLLGYTWRAGRGLARRR